MAGGPGPELGPDAPHLPTPAPIDAYGNGGFRFAGMSHRGSLLCFPDGIWAWPVAGPRDLTEALVAPALARADQLDFF
ncbi:MAG TPA: MTH938/NDUFAF3 family protein, partial [Pseudolabrys sp.]|nr:MTH938/NDUFAF3 family protein [Pseudolabrys sp.]